MKAAGPDMAEHPTSFFIEATPLAVFSILADLENRPRFIRGVRRVVLRTHPPVGAGTRFREWRISPLPGWGHGFMVGDFVPPDRLSLLRWRTGIRLEATYRLQPDHGGTRVDLAVTGRCALWPRFPISTLARIFAHRWKRRLQSDLLDIKRYASRRANPEWRDSLSSKRPTADRMSGRG